MFICLNVYFSMPRQKDFLTHHVTTVAFLYVSNTESMSKQLLERVFIAQEPVVAQAVEHRRGDARIELEFFRS